MEPAGGLRETYLLLRGQASPWDLQYHLICELVPRVSCLEEESMGWGIMDVVVVVLFFFGGGGEGGQ